MADRTCSKPEATRSTDALSASSFIQLARVMARTSVARKASTADDQRCHQVCIVASFGRAGLGGSMVHGMRHRHPPNPIVPHAGGLGTECAAFAAVLTQGCPYLGHREVPG